MVSWRSGAREEDQVRTVHNHEDGVMCLIRLPGGGLASGGWDGVVAVWARGDHRVRAVYNHEGRVDCLIRLPRGAWPAVAQTAWWRSGSLGSWGRFPVGAMTSAASSSLLEHHRPLMSLAGG